MKSHKDKTDLIIKRLELKPHPEGGFFKETYRSEINMPEKNLPGSFGGRRQSATSILFLLTSNDLSVFHHLNQDEVWYFHEGDPVILHMIYKDGKHTMTKLGKTTDDALPQATVPAGTLFAAETTGAYSLVGCMTSPGFDFADLKMPNRKTLLDKYPHFEKTILKFTRS